MFCTSCGKKIRDDSRFCPFCGQGVTPAAGAGAQVAASVATSSQPSAGAPVPVVQADINKQVSAARSSSRRKMPTLLLVVLVTMALAGAAFAAVYIYKNFVEPSLNGGSPAITEQGADAEDEYEYVWAVSQVTVTGAFSEPYTGHYTYDDAGRLASIEFGESGPFGYTTDKTFTYNNDGSVATIAWDYANYDSGGGTTTGSSDSGSWSYTYNDDGTVASINEGVGDAASPYITYTYTNGVPVSASYNISSNYLVSATADADGNISALVETATEGQGYSSQRYTRDSSGNITSAIDSRDAGESTITFEYDDYGNLVKVTNGDPVSDHVDVYEFTYEIHKVKKGSYIPTVYTNPNAYEYETVMQPLAQFEWLSASDISRILAAPRDSEVMDYTQG